MRTAFKQVNIASIRTSLPPIPRSECLPLGLQDPKMPSQAGEMLDRVDVGQWVGLRVSWKPVGTRRPWARSEASNTSYDKWNGLIRYIKHAFIEWMCGRRAFGDGGRGQAGVVAESSLRSSDGTQTRVREGDWRFLPLNSRADTFYLESQHCLATMSLLQQSCCNVSGDTSHRFQ